MFRENTGFVDDIDGFAEISNLGKILSIVQI